MVLLRREVRLAKWSLHIHIRIRIAQQYLRSCLNVYPTSLIQIEFLRFQHDLSVTGNAVKIFLATQDDILEILESTCTDFGLKIPSSQLSSLTMNESLLRIIIDAIRSPRLTHFIQVHTYIHNWPL